MGFVNDPGSSRSDLREIAFYLPEASNAPAPVEFLWGQPLGDGLFRVLSSPYYVEGIANGDVIEAADNAELHFVRLVRSSGHSTLRVFLEPDVVSGDLFERLRRLGCKLSPTERDRYLVLDIRGEIDITEVLDLLSDGQNAGHSDWAAGSISPTHAEALRAVMDPDNLPDWIPKS
jgi:hypothetical protein